MKPFVPFQPFPTKGLCSLSVNKCSYLLNNVPNAIYMRQALGLFVSFQSFPIVDIINEVSDIFQAKNFVHFQPTNVPILPNNIPNARNDETTLCFILFLFCYIPNKEFLLLVCPLIPILPINVPNFLITILQPYKKQEHFMSNNLSGGAKNFAKSL